MGPRVSFGGEFLGGAATPDLRAASARGVVLGGLNLYRSALLAAQGPQSGCVPDSGDLAGPRT